MGLLVKLFNDASDTEFKLAQDLVAIAMADGNISESERKVIMEICQSEGISADMLDDFMLGLDKEAVNRLPNKQRDRTDYLTKLIRVMGVDGYSSHMEDGNQSHGIGFVSADDSHTSQFPRLHRQQDTGQLFEECH